MRFNIPLLSGIFSAAVGNISPRSATLKSASRTCARLQTVLGSEVVLISGEEYLASASNAWNLYNAVSKPSCIVDPRATSHVQIAMAAIFKDKVPYAVRAGGHSAMTGWNTVQDGVLFFFSHMKNVSYDPTRDTITLQPGIHWGDAITQLEPQLGVAPMGGRLGDVGTGLLLGGGLSPLSAEHGFSSDAYRELDVVLVTGQLVTATATNGYSDLFRALKGGGNRFGIVTRYEVDAIHTGTQNDKNWFGGLIMYPNSSADALIQATEKYVRTVTDPKASILVAFTNTVNGTAIVASHILTLFYHGSELPPSIFGDFLAIPSTFSQLSPVSYAEVSNILGSGGVRGSGQLFGASVVDGLGGLQQYAATFKSWNNYTSAIQGSLYGSVLAFTPILESQILASRAKGGNLMDPPLRNYAAVQLATQMPLGVQTLPPVVDAALQVLLQQVPRSPEFPMYVNECAANQNVLATYGRYKEMKRIYAKYDPTRFNVRFTEGPIGL